MTSWTIRNLFHTALALVALAMMTFVAADALGRSILLEPGSAIAVAKG